MKAPIPLQRPQFLAWNSLFTKISALSLSLGMLAVIVLIAYLFLSLKMRNLREMEERAQVFSTVTTLSLVEPLWEFNQKSVEDIGESLLAEPSIALVSIRDTLGRIHVLKVAPDQDEITVDRFDPQSFLQITRSIQRGDEQLGTLVLIWDKRPTLVRIWETSVRLSFTGFFLIAAVSLSIAFSVRKLVIQPIQKLRTQTEEIRRGNLLASIPVGRNDELGLLAQDFAHMRDSVRDKQDSLLAMNQKLSEQIRLVQTAEEQVRHNYERLSQEVQARQKLEMTNAQLHAEMNRAAEQLIQAEKMVLLGTLVASVAHDLANPTQLLHQTEKHLRERLGAIQERLVALLGQAEEDDDLRLIKQTMDRDLADMFDGLGEMKLGADVIQGIQGAIRNQARTDTHPEEFLVGGLLRECLIVLKSKLALWKIQVDCPEDLIAFGKRSQIGQIIMNLLGNAIDAMEEKGVDPSAYPVSLILRGYPKESFGSGSRTILELEDCGPGIPLAKREKVFEAFYTTKPVGIGTGLGLAICRRIVEQGEGTICVIDAKALQGACFHIDLPAKGPREEKRSDTSRTDV